MSLLAALPIALLALALGFGAGRLALGPRAGASGVAFAAGLATLHLALYGASIAGLRWSDGALAGASLVAVAAAVWAWRGGGGRGRRPLPGWGDAVALAALAVFSWHALELRILLSDFIYHWGVKGERFFLLRGVDWSFLSGFASWRVHPDYPTLVPELYALTAILARGFAPEPMMVWSVLFALAIVLAARGALQRGGLPAWGRQAGVAACGLLVAGYAFTNGLVGGADWLPAWALALALPALLGPPDTGADWRIAAASAVAAAGKMEGVPLGAFLVVVHLARALRAGRLRGLAAAGATLARSGLLPALVVLPWLAQSFRLHLFQRSNTGAFSLERLQTVFATLLDIARLGRPWYGLPVLLLVVPVLFLSRRTRAAATVIALQCLFILYAWASPPIDNELLVRWSADRLFFQLLPALAVLAVDAALDSAAPDATPAGGPRLQPDGDAAILHSRDADDDR